MTPGATVRAVLIREKNLNVIAFSNQKSDQSINIKQLQAKNTEGKEISIKQENVVKGNRKSKP